MEILMAHEDKPDSGPAGITYLPGQRVMITHGPFSSFEGIFQKSANERVKVLLSLFGSQREIELPAQDIAPAA